jgi:hypothetical protein
MLGKVWLEIGTQWGLQSSKYFPLFPNNGRQYHSLAHRSSSSFRPQKWVSVLKKTENFAYEPGPFDHPRPQLGLVHYA